MFTNILDFVEAFCVELQNRGLNSKLWFANNEYLSSNVIKINHCWYVYFNSNNIELSYVSLEQIPFEYNRVRTHMTIDYQDPGLFDKIMKCIQTI